MTASQSTHNVLRIRDLHVSFAVSQGTVHAVRGVDIDVDRGEVVAVVGESGSGKSTVMLAVMNLLAPNAQVTGSALFAGTELIGAQPAILRRLRGQRIAMVFQDPLTSLNPVLRIGHQLVESIRVNRRVDSKTARHRALELLELVAIPRARDRLNSYPHELSGGMRQRVMIAMAMANDPELLIADEPTTALDVTVQAQVLELLMRLREELGLAVVLVTHDLGVVAGMADRVHVMYAGSLAERGGIREIFYQPSHPYTRGLLACSPRLDGQGELIPIAGDPPVLSELPQGCPFAPRCPNLIDRCRTEVPLMRRSTATDTACHVAIAGGGHQ